MIRSALTLCILILSFQAVSEELILHAPEHSSDGSYILHLEDQINFDFDKLELYRNINGSEYRLLVIAPLFKAISQMVSENGVYGYKIRGIKGSELGEFSEPVYVRVFSKSIQLQTAWTSAAAASANTANSAQVKLVKGLVGQR